MTGIRERALARVQSQLKEAHAKANEAKEKAQAAEALRKEQQEQAKFKWRHVVQEKVSGLEIERKEEEQGRTTWRAKDFGGQYHRSKIKNPYPIAGTAIEVERVRKEAAGSKAERFADGLSKLRAESEERIARKGQTAQDAEKVKAKFGTRRYLHADVDSLLDAREERLAKVQERYDRERGALGATWSKRQVRFIESVRAGDVETVRSVLQLGLVKPNEVASFNNGRTALIEACECGRVSTVHVLLDFGADPSQKDMNGRGTLHAMWDPVRALPVHERPKRATALKNVESILEHLIAHGVDLTMRNVEGETALHFAAEARHTGLCRMILQNGETTLLDARDAKGRTPVDMIEEATSECRRLLSNWKLCTNGLRLAEFEREWKAFVDDAKPGPRLAVGASTKKVLHDLEVADWGRTAQSIMSETLLTQAAREAAEASLEAERARVRQPGKTESASSNRDVEVDNASKPVLDFVREAQLHYTATYRARVQEERRRLKPSHRKLTLIEYLVGSDVRKRAEAHDMSKSVRGRKHKLQARRIALGQSLLSDKYQGGPRIEHPAGKGGAGSAAAAAATTAAADDNLSGDAWINNATLTRPWTASALAQPAQATRLAIRHRVAAASTCRPSTSNTIATTVQSYARRRAAVPSEDVIVNRSELVVSGAVSLSAAAAVAGKSATETLAEKIGKYSKRETVRLSDMYQKPAQRDAKAVGNDSEIGSTSVHSAKASAAAESSSADTWGSEVSVHKRAIRRQALATTRPVAVDAFKSIEALRAEAEYARSQTAERSKRRQLNESRVLPPRVDERAVMSSLKLSKGGKSRFSRIELGDALAVLERKLGRSKLPRVLREALLRSVDSDGANGRESISLEELRVRFAVFMYNGEEINAEPVLDALERCLTAKHKFDMLHTSLTPYCDFASQGPPRPTPYEERPVNSEPWSSPYATASFSNAFLARHEENPFVGRQFDPAMLKTQVP